MWLTDLRTKASLPENSKVMKCAEARTGLQQGCDLQVPECCTPQTWTLKGFSNTSRWNRHLESWTVHLIFLTLMDIIWDAIHNPNHCKTVVKTVASLRHQEQTPLSWAVTIHQCLPCVQEGLSVLQRPRFRLRIGHWLDLRLRHDLNLFFFCADGRGPSALWLVFCAFTRGKVNKRASQDGRHGRPDTSWKTQRQTCFFFPSSNERRVANWHRVNFGRKRWCQRFLTLKRTGLPWKLGHMQTRPAFRHAAVDKQDISLWQACLDAKSLIKNIGT